MSSENNLALTKYFEKTKKEEIILPIAYEKGD